MTFFRFRSGYRGYRHALNVLTYIDLSGVENYRKNQSMINQRVRERSPLMTYVDFRTVNH